MHPQPEPAEHGGGHLVRLGGRDNLDS